MSGAKTPPCKQNSRVKERAVRNTRQPREKCCYYYWPQLEIITNPQELWYKPAPAAPSAAVTMTMSRTATATGPEQLPGAALPMRPTDSGKHRLLRERRGRLQCRDLRLRNPSMRLVTPLGRLATSWTRITLSTCTGEHCQCVLVKSVF